ncbi:MAG TPA: helix-turn-helix domain-containing protein [Candidatus Limnocylindria bacterium]|nr:helix-turn-helix domain-containing protein [Candidatus Limnocylindria bacterium]
MTHRLTKLGDVLRNAREAREIDLESAERDTRIRSRYLSALERSEYRALPGSVYTTGFLRTYATYLGLDADEMLDLYRLETGPVGRRAADAPEPTPLPIRPRRTFAVNHAVVLGVLLTVFVVAFVTYIGVQLARFAGTPELAITDPPGDVASARVRTYTIRGVTEPRARVTVDSAGRRRHVTAAADGAFSVAVDLVPGPNLLTVVARDPETGRDSGAQRRIITVAAGPAGPSPSAGDGVVLVGASPAAAAERSPRSAARWLPSPA